MSSVSVLFVDANGNYPKMGLDCWDMSRDARLYGGSNPVIAHPPCQLWVNFAELNFKRYGGEHNRPGNDGGCFASALKSVRVWGGVIEHPAGSRAWPAFGLTKPSGPGWQCVGGGPGTRAHWVCEVWQSAYGHKARKATWLYYVGASAPIDANWMRSPGTHQCGWFDRIKPTLGKAEASATPPAFARYLVNLAMGARL